MTKKYLIYLWDNLSGNLLSHLMGLPAVFGKLTVMYGYRHKMQEIFVKKFVLYTFYIIYYKNNKANLISE